MKISTKKILTSLILITIISLTVKAQTNVSGGIYSNTTWTLANSPYIVVDTTVVFPGVTLTIEPGVTVKFDDHIYLEIRQATLVATGTVSDSITFTSNNPAPTPGIWGHTNNGGIWFNNSFQPAINFWNVSFATKGLVGVYLLPYLKNSIFTNNLIGIGTISNTPVDSCIFKNNGTGIVNLDHTTLNFCSISNNYYGVEWSGYDVLNNCTLDSNYRAFGGVNGHMSDVAFHHCMVRYNHDGLVGSKPDGGNLIDHCSIVYNSGLALAIGKYGSDAIINCEIKFNSTGAYLDNGSSLTECDVEYNTVGIIINHTNVNLTCNKICNNTSYGLQLNMAYNYNAGNNFWCTTDSTQIAAAIHDGYDNIAYGLVTFLPVDSTCFISTSIPINESNNFSISVFPNPFQDELTISINNHQPVEVILYDLTSRKLLQQTFTNSINLNTQHLAKGMYLYEVRTKTAVISKGKVVKE